MASKKNVKTYLYEIGMILIIIGCFLPLISSKVKNPFLFSAFELITADKISGALKVASVLILAGAIAGLVLSFVNVVQRKLLQFASIIISILGGAYVFFNYVNVSNTSNGLIKLAAKVTNTTPSIGFVLICIGWVIALAGFFMRKD